MTTPIQNKAVAELAETLASLPRPTGADIREAIALAYSIGRSDGAIESCDKFLETLGPKVVA